MKSKAAAALLSVILAAGIMTPPVWAEETAKTAQETEDTGTEDDTVVTTEADSGSSESEEQKTTEKAPDFTVELNDTETVVQNDSGITFEKAEYKKEDEEETGTLTLTEKEGDVHTFEEVSEEEWTDPICYEEYGFIYIKYTDAQGTEQELSEKAGEKELEEEVTVYATSNVNVRKEADKDSDRIDGVKLGDVLTVTAAAPGWLKVKLDEDEGYVAHSYFTEDKEEAEALKKAAEEQAAAEQAAAEQAAAEQAAAEQAAAEQAAAEQAAAEQAAAEQAAAEQAAAEQAAAEQAAAEQAAAEQAAAEQAAAERTVVSVQDYPDCDGSGHGYREITYSDGSVEYEDY